MYRHLFWDMGGTLIDTYPQLDATLAGVVRAHGHDVDPKHVARLTRRSTGEAIATLSAEFGIDEAEFHEANALLKKAWSVMPAPVTAGARELMQQARDAGGLNLVVTHRDRTSAEALLRALDLEVDDMVCAPDGFPRKPSPAMHLELLHRHELDASECLAIGDRAIDAEAACAAGITAAFLCSPPFPPPPGIRMIETLAELQDEVGA